VARKPNYLSEQDILNFIDRYQKKINVKMITFCGGEVFLLPYFSELVNKLTEEYDIFVQIITNGTIERLDELARPNSMNLIVSIDGAEEYHDKNRGKGNFKKSIEFLKKAKAMGFHTEIFSILTKQNYSQIAKFEKEIFNSVEKIEITYHPKKPIEYLENHPIDNINKTNEGFDFLTDEQMQEIYQSDLQIFPPKDLGCFQISLFSNGKIYGCCEGVTEIGSINSTVEEIITKLKNSIKDNCADCKFMCGIKKYLEI
jgi:MoaA/NifB/PqqE/SkfB family radical SAM enzyme